MLYKTEKGHTFIFPSTGTGAWESGLVNTLNPGDKARQGVLGRMREG